MSKYADAREEWSVESFLAAEKDAEYTLRQMREAYEIAEQQIADDINRILGVVISRNNMEITPAELRKNLSKAETRTWKKTVEQYMQEIEALGINTPEGQALWMELEYLSALTRVTRLEALQMSIDANMARVAALEESAFTTHLEDVFKDDYYANMYAYYLMDVPEVNALMEAHGVAVTNTLVNTIVNEVWRGHTLSERIWKNEWNMAYRIRETTSNVLVSGASPKRVARELSKELGVAYKNSERLVLTETARIKTEADLKSYDDAGFKEVEWNATLDSRTCSECGAKDKKVFVASEMKEEQKPPLHPRCRCLLTPINEYIKNLEGKFSYTRFARDEEGNAIWVDGKMSYSDWKAEYIDNPKKKRDNERIEEVHKLIRENPDRYPIKVHKGQQNKHIEGTREYKQELENGNHKGILTEDTEMLIEKYFYSATPRFDAKGNWTKRAAFEHDSVIGVYITESGDERMETTRGIIHYSKKGSHIVPAYPKGE